MENRNSQTPSGMIENHRSVRVENINNIINNRKHNKQQKTCDKTQEVWLESSENIQQNVGQIDSYTEERILLSQMRVVSCILFKIIIAILIGH